MANRDVSIEALLKRTLSSTESPDPALVQSIKDGKKLVDTILEQQGQAYGLAAKIG